MVYTNCQVYPQSEKVWIGKERGQLRNSECLLCSTHFPFISFFHHTQTPKRRGPSCFPLRKSNIIKEVESFSRDHTACTWESYGLLVSFSEFLKTCLQTAELWGTGATRLAVQSLAHLERGYAGRPSTRGSHCSRGTCAWSPGGLRRCPQRGE